VATLTPGITMGEGEATGGGSLDNRGGATHGQIFVILESLVPRCRRVDGEHHTRLAVVGLLTIEPCGQLESQKHIHNGVDTVTVYVKLGVMLPSVGMNPESAPSASAR
jgi:hypothetical protein